MKKILLIGAAFAPLAMAGAAHAASTANATVNLNATVPNTCYIVSLSADGDDDDDGDVSQTNASNTNSATVSVNYGTSLANSNTAVRKASTVTYSLNAYCNYASHSVGIKSDNGGMTNTATTTSIGTFDRRIPYTASFSWGSTTPSVSATGPMNTGVADSDFANVTSTSAVNTTANLNIVTTNGTNPLLAGSYSDVLRVRLGGTF